MNERTTIDHKVGIGEYKVAAKPDRIMTLGLGSCVGVTLYDLRTGLGGLVHVMLPDSTQFTNQSNPFKYADLGLPLLLEAMLKGGASRRSLEARMAGGAQMFSFKNTAPTLNIGARNTEMCLAVLARLGVPLVARDTGGNYGRTMILHTVDGRVFLRRVGHDERLL